MVHHKIYIQPKQFKMILDKMTNTYTAWKSILMSFRRHPITVCWSFVNFNKNRFSKNNGGVEIDQKDKPRYSRNWRVHRRIVYSRFKQSVRWTKVQMRKLNIFSKKVNEIIRLRPQINFNFTQKSHWHYRGYPTTTAYCC